MAAIRGLAGIRGARCRVVRAATATETLGPCGSRGQRFRAKVRVGRTSLPERPNRCAK